MTTYPELYIPEWAGVGKLVGELVGENVGLLVGKKVGPLVGDGVGASVGKKVGGPVGEEEGRPVGEGVTMISGDSTSSSHGGWMRPGTIGQSAETDSLIRAIVKRTKESFIVLFAN